MTPIAQISSFGQITRSLPSQTFSRGLADYVAAGTTLSSASSVHDIQKMNQLIGHIYTAILAAFILWVAHSLHEIQIASLVRGLTLLMVIPIAIYVFVPRHERDADHLETESSTTIKKLESALNSSTTPHRSPSSKRSSTKTSRSRTPSTQSIETSATEIRTIGILQKLSHASTMPIARRSSKSSSPSRSIDSAERPASSPSARLPNYTGETHFQRPSFNIPRPRCPHSRSRGDVQKPNSVRSLSATHIHEHDALSLHAESLPVKRASKLKRFMNFKKGLGRRDSL